MVIANNLFQQHKRRLYTWTSPDGQYQNETDYIIYSWRWRNSIQSANRRPGADCGSDHELLTVKFSLKLKKVGKTTGSFRYDLNHIPYDYTVEVTDQGIRSDRKSAWRTMDGGLWHRTGGRVYRRQGSRPSARKRNAKRQNGCLKRPYK